MHLGAPYIENPRAHEARFVKWLDTVSKDATEIYLMGDIFDFWWEYKKVAPRGFTRFLGKLSEVTDSGVKVYFFTGNHDIWVFDYLETETGVEVIRKPIVKEISGKRFYLAHGDGLGDPSRGFKIISKLFRSKWLQFFMTRFVHPHLTMSLGHWWSGKSRMGHADKKELKYRGENNEYLVQYAKSILMTGNTIDIFIFGHRHILLDLMLSKSSRVLILGDWLSHFSYGVFNGTDIWLENWEDN